MLRRVGVRNSPSSWNRTTPPPRTEHARRINDIGTRRGVGFQGPPGQTSFVQVRRSGSRRNFWFEPRSRDPRTRAKTSRFDARSDCQPRPRTGPGIRPACTGWLIKQSAGSEAGRLVPDHPRTQPSNLSPQIFSNPRRCGRSQDRVSSHKRAARYPPVLTESTGPARMAYGTLNLVDPSCRR